jgi:hypothetical protein
MMDESKFERTLSDAELRELPQIETVIRFWGNLLPHAVATALSSLTSVCAGEAEAMLSPLIDEQGDRPEIWWGLAIAMVGQNDLESASTCYENFRDRVEIEVALAHRDCHVAPDMAHGRLQRLVPSLVRCRDYPLAARGLVMASGLEQMFGTFAEAKSRLRESLPPLRSSWPRQWGLVAEWLTTVAVTHADQTDFRRAERSLRLAMRIAQREADNHQRIAMIGRELGLLLQQSDRTGAAETVLATAMVAANQSENLALQSGIAIAQATTLCAQRRFVEAINLLDTILTRDLPYPIRAQALTVSADVMIRLGSHHQDRTQLETAKAAAAEAVSLLNGAHLDASAAMHAQSVAAVMLGDLKTARAIAFALLRASGVRTRPPIERVTLAYLPYLIRKSEGAARKSLFWAEYRLRIAKRAGIDRPRDLMMFREHCVAAAQRLADLDTVRLHALAMLDAEAEMLRTALDDAHGAADWNRHRIAREALSILAAMEAGSGETGAGWRQAEALLLGRGLARSVRGARNIIYVRSVREFAKLLAVGERLLALVSLHPPAPVDPDVPWASNLMPARLISIIVTSPDEEPLIDDLGDFAETADDIRWWIQSLSEDRQVKIPACLSLLSERLGDARSLLVLAEGMMELIPLRLLAPQSVIHHISGIRGYYDHGVATAPALIVASNMLDASLIDESATVQEMAVVKAAFDDVRLRDVGYDSCAEVLALLATVPRHVHIIAHGAAIVDPREIELNVYMGAAIDLGSELLTASSVADLRLDGVELVILSCCDTSKGAAQHAEGLASTAAAFLDAGARAAIASLWRVPHEETAWFMALLYAQDLSDPANGLAAAQACAQAEGLSVSSWAAWVVHESGVRVDQDQFDVLEQMPARGSRDQGAKSAAKQVIDIATYFESSPPGT